MNWDDNKLTDEKRSLLKQGTKVEFKWHGNKSLVYTGRIEVLDGALYFCAEHNYEGDSLTESGKSMQYYNDLDGFYYFTHFEIIN